MNGAITPYNTQGKEDETLDALESMCAHALAYDRSYEEDHGKSYSSIFTDKLIYPEHGKDFHELTEHNQSWYMLDRKMNYFLITSPGAIVPKAHITFLALSPRQAENIVEKSTLRDTCDRAGVPSFCA